MADKTKTSNSAVERELEKAQKNFEEFDQNIKDMTLDRMNTAPKVETEMQTKLSQKEIASSRDIYLKPERSIAGKDRFNEKYREEYEKAKEFVCFIAENKEIIGETIDIWTKPFAGVPAEEWKVPTNKPVYGPRYLADQIKKCCYHRFVMQDRIVETTGVGSMYGSMAVDNTVQRLDAIPTTKKRSIFMGAEGF
jgi:hypothetical protein